MSPKFNWKQYRKDTKQRKISGSISDTLFKKNHFKILKSERDVSLPPIELTYYSEVAFSLDKQAS